MSAAKSHGLGKLPFKVYSSPFCFSSLLTSPARLLSPLLVPHFTSCTEPLVKLCTLAPSPAPKSHHICCHFPPLVLLHLSFGHQWMFPSPCQGQASELCNLVPSQCDSCFIFRVGGLVCFFRSLGRGCVVAVQLCQRRAFQCVLCVCWSSADMLQLVGYGLTLLLHWVLNILNFSDFGLICLYSVTMQVTAYLRREIFQVELSLYM